jgi:Fe-S-cluster containining protein
MGRGAAAPSYDCTRCGACCQNPDDNVAEGYTFYLAIEDGAPLLRDAKLVSRLVMHDADGKPHLRLESNGRCLALRGKIGRQAVCTIYDVRPQGCRKLQPGDARCEQARRERGVGG